MFPKFNLPTTSMGDEYRRESRDLRSGPHPALRVNALSTLNPQHTQQETDRNNQLVTFKKQVQQSARVLQNLQGSSRQDALHFLQGVMRSLLQSGETKPQEGTRHSGRFIEISTDTDPCDGSNISSSACVPHKTVPFSTNHGRQEECEQQSTSDSCLSMEQRVARLEEILRRVEAENFMLKKQLTASETANGVHFGAINDDTSVIKPASAISPNRGPEKKKNFDTITSVLPSEEGEVGTSQIETSPNKVANNNIAVPSVESDGLPGLHKRFLRSMSAARVPVESITNTSPHSCQNNNSESHITTPDVGSESAGAREGSSKKRGPHGPHSKQVRHTCKLCGRKFTHGRPFHNHLQQHDVESHVCCRKCHAEFTNVPLFNHHHCANQRHQIRHICPHCSEVFRNVKRLNAHMRIRHKAKPFPRHFCSECGRGYVKKDSLKRHLLEHSGVKQICQKCSKTFDSDEAYLEHMAWHDSQAKYLCSRCGIHIQHRHTYMRHLVAHEMYDCRICEEMFTQRRLLKSHLQEKHNIRMKEKPSVPALSGTQENTSIAAVSKSPNSSAAVVTADTDHHAEGPRNSTDSPSDDNDGDDCDDNADDDMSHGEEISTAFAQPELEAFPLTGLVIGKADTQRGDDMYRCDLCKSTFHGKKALEKHNRTFTHQRRLGVTHFPQNHLCPTCGKSYHRRQDMQRHLRYHNNERPHSCPHCSYRCQEKANLQRHIALHFNRRDFVCDYCGAAFHNKKTLETHVLFKHSTKREFACTECSRAFKTKSSLQRHVHVHGSARQHNCEYCSAGFNRQYNLRRHMKTVHGTDDRLPPVKRVRLVDAPEGEEYKKGAALQERIKSSKSSEAVDKLEHVASADLPVDCAAVTAEDAFLIITPGLSSVTPEATSLPPDALLPNTVSITPIASSLPSYSQQANLHKLQLANPAGASNVTNIQTLFQQCYIPPPEMPQQPSEVVQVVEYNSDVYGTAPSLLQLMQSTS